MGKSMASSESIVLVGLVVVSFETVLGCRKSDPQQVLVVGFESIIVIHPSSTIRLWF